jgi:hypothetical protein
MAYITGSVIDSFGVLPFSLSAGTQLSMSIQNSLPGVSYYGLETVPDGNGFYNPTTPRNLSGSFILGSGIVDVVYDDYKMVAAVAPGGGTLTYTPAVAIMADTLRTRGTGASLGPVDFGTLLASSYSKRVTAAGGYVESPDSITAAIAATPILKDASFLYVPSGYASGTAFSELSTNDYGDLTWSRASDGTRINSERSSQRVPWNLAVWSEDLTNVSWVAADSTQVLANTPATLDPQGGNMANFIFCKPSGGAAVQGFSQTIPAVVSGSYTMSVFVKKAVNFDWFRIRFERAAGEGASAFFNIASGSVGFVDSGSTATIRDYGNGWYRVTHTRTSASSSIRMDFRLASADNVLTVVPDGVSGTYVWGAQVDEGTTAQPYLPTTTRLNVPRLDYTYGTSPASLLEPQRTNQIRNSTMQGASLGFPGVNPTNWQTDAVGDWIVGLGIENGLSYIDYRLTGSTAGLVDSNIRFEPPNQISASSGQNWTSTFYAKLVSGNTGSGQLFNTIAEFNSGGGFVTNVSSSIAATSTLSRFTLTTTNSPATTAWIRNSLDFRGSNTAWDFVVRIAAPQLELGAYATTFIPTTTTAATRIVDTFSRNNIYTNNIITSNGGTWYVELTNNRQYIRDAGNFPLFISNTTSSGGTSTSLEFRNATGSLSRLTLLVRTGSVGTGLFTTTTDNLKAAFKWNGSNVTAFVTGSNVGSLAFNATNMNFLNGFGTDVPLYIQQMALFNEPISNVDAGVLTGASYFTSFAEMAQADNYTIA